MQRKRPSGKSIFAGRKWRFKVRMDHKGKYAPIPQKLSDEIDALWRAMNDESTKRKK